ncbi:MAG: hypothetical protein IJR99_04830 [Kiritimatiellae bacterium]|nr:hypothetical protein [Kiritimatiellia bacterium]
MMKQRIKSFCGSVLCGLVVMCTSTHDAAAQPAGWAGNGGYDGQEQADYMDAVFTLLEKEPWCIGFMWWKWDEQNDRPQFKDAPAGDKGFTVRGKPAQEVMRRHFSQPSGGAAAKQ